MRRLNNCQSEGQRAFGSHTHGKLGFTWTHPVCHKKTHTGLPAIDPFFSKHWEHWPGLGFLHTTKPIWWITCSLILGIMRVIYEEYCHKCSTTSLIFQIIFFTLCKIYPQHWQWRLSNQLLWYYTFICTVVLNVTLNKTILPMPKHLPGCIVITAIN